MYEFAIPDPDETPEHDPEKWRPVFRKDARIKRRDHDPIQFDRIMVASVSQAACAVSPRVPAVV
jgi:hypothetical protein